MQSGAGRYFRRAQPRRAASDDGELGVSVQSAV